MTKWIETTGRSEEDAIAAALFQLKLERDDVSVEVIERAKSGFLGFGSNPAKVRVRYEVPDEASETPKTKPQPVQKPQQAPRREAVEAQPKPAPQVQDAPQKAQAVAVATAEQAGEKEGHIRQFLQGLMEQMGIQATIQIEGSDKDGYRVVLEGSGMGAIIGRRGETLDAIQQLANYAVNRGQNKRVRIHLDTENYRKKREETLCNLATKVAGKVVKYRKSITLESMNAYERHIIHAALQEYPGVRTHSTGVDPNRRIVVSVAD